MNEKIKELAEQAEFKTFSPVGSEEWQKIFAELIIKDIIFIVEGYCETSPEIYGLPLDILEHFDMEVE